ncbi:hypothetical protein P9112_005606 [Eukaryota sp. TZLM1-RC]
MSEVCQTSFKGDPLYPFLSIISNTMNISHHEMTHLTPSQTIEVSSCQTSYLHKRASSGQNSIPRLTHSETLSPNQSPHSPAITTLTTAKYSQDNPLAICPELEALLAALPKEKKKRSKRTS